MLRSSRTYQQTNQISSQRWATNRGAELPDEITWHTLWPSSLIVTPGGTVDQIWSHHDLENPKRANAATLIYIESESSWL